MCTHLTRVNSNYSEAWVRDGVPLAEGISSCAREKEKEKKKSESLTDSVQHSVFLSVTGESLIIELWLEGPFAAPRRAFGFVRCVDHAVCDPLGLRPRAPKFFPIGSFFRAEIEKSPSSWYGCGSRAGIRGALILDLSVDCGRCIHSLCIAPEPLAIHDLRTAGVRSRTGNSSCCCCGWIELLDGPEHLRRDLESPLQARGFGGGAPNKCSLDSVHLGRVWYRVVYCGV
jgi:hypothetical protein